MRSTSKAAKRAEQEWRRQEAVEKLCEKPEARGRRRGKERHHPPQAVQGAWAQLPVPFLARLCEYLDGRECQRCATLFGWPASLLQSAVFRSRLRELSHAQRPAAFSSQRPRRHRDYHGACAECGGSGPVRPCRQCRQSICSACSPFDRETKEAFFWCASCEHDRVFNGT